MRLLVAVALVATWLNTASAQRFDLNLISCRELLGTNRQNVTYLIVWLRGFWTEADEAMVLDLERLQTDADKVTDFCVRNPDEKACGGPTPVRELSHRRGTRKSGDGRSLLVVRGFVCTATCCKS